MSSTTKTDSSATVSQEAPPTTAAAGRLVALGPWAVPFLLVALFAVFAVASPDTFATTTNVRVMLEVGWMRMIAVSGFSPSASTSLAHTVAESRATPE